ncbi:MAG: pyridoxal phosphate-dependent aminotransferase [Sandaracinaceae bacterium]
MFSTRSEIAQAANPLTEALAARRARGAPILDLTQTNPTLAGFEVLLPSIQDALTEGLRGPYLADSLGLPKARAALVEREELAAKGHPPDRVLLTASTSEAYAHLFRLLCDPGAEVLVPQPSYPLLAHLAAYTDVHLTGYPLVFDGRWSIDFAALYDAITPRTRAVVAISPNHPTGQYLRPDTLAALSSLGFPLIVDEVFAPYGLDAAPPPPPAETEGLVFRLDGLSKRAGLPQLKLAWTFVHGPGAAADEAMDRLAMIADTYLSPATPVQRALPVLLEATLPRQTRIRERCRRNLAKLRERTSGTALSVPPLEGGWVAPVRVPATRSDEAWALALVERGLSVHPGYFYDFEGDEAWLVVSLLVPEDEFDEGVGRLVAAVVEEA